MVVNGNFDAVVVADAAFAERAGAPHEHATAMPQLAVKGLDHPCAGLAHDVGRGGQHLRVGAPGIGKVAGVPPVAFGQRPPQTQERGRAARAQHPGRCAATCARRPATARPCGFAGR